MKIDITDEMREAFQAAAGWPGPPWRFGEDVARGLAAVLALVEREHRAEITPLPDWLVDLVTAAARAGVSQGHPHLTWAQIHDAIPDDVKRQTSHALHRRAAMRDDYCAGCGGQGCHECDGWDGEGA